MTDEKGTVIKEETVEVKQSDLEEITNLLKKKDQKGIEGRWINETKNQNGIIINTNGFTEVLFYDDIERLKEREDIEVVRSRIYEQERTIEKDQIED